MIDPKASDELGLCNLVALSDDLGLYDMPPRACVTHRRVWVCRAQSGCEWTEDPAQVQAIMRGNISGAL